MSRVDSVTPAGPTTVAPGGTVDFAVAVSGVPGDDIVTLRFAASDGSAQSVGVTVDRQQLAAILSGAPQANEVLGEVLSGGGTLTVLSVTGGVATFRYTAPG